VATRRSVAWTPLARDGLDEVIAHIAEDSPETAEKVLETILGVAESLSLFSERGRVVPELHDSSIHEVFVYRYRMIYMVDSPNSLGPNTQGGTYGAIYHSHCGFREGTS
jgi:plasmid stabilization system protein ParE